VQPYKVTVMVSPGHQPKLVRAIKALSDEHARAVAIRVAEAWHYRRRIPRYRVTWRLDRVDSVSGQDTAIGSGNLISAAQRRDAQ